MWNRTKYHERLRQSSHAAAEENAGVTELAAPIAKCGVLYLGSVVPRSNLVGLESIQEPLSRRYPTDNTNSVYGIDVVLIVRENGVEMSFVQDPSISLFYPIESLVYCASVKFATLPHNGELHQSSWPLNNALWGFMPLDSPVTKLPDSQHHPPLFCSIFKRTRNVAADECHCFITKTRESAMVLVQACFTSFSKQQNLHPQNFHSNCLIGKRIPIYIKSAIPPINGSKGSMNEQCCYEIDNTNIKVIEAPTSNPIVDFMTNANGEGFFYTSKNAVIDSWQLWEERSASSKMLTANPRAGELNGSRDRAVYGKTTSKERSSRSASGLHRPSTQSEGSSFESATDYYQTVGQKYELPKHLEEDVKRSVRVHSTVIDPYEPAPNLVKVEHKRDPVTGTNIFIRWFQPEDGEDGRANEEPEEEEKVHPPLARQVDKENDDSKGTARTSSVRASKNVAPAPKISRKKEIVVIKEMPLRNAEKNGGYAKSPISGDKKANSNLKSILRSRNHVYRQPAEVRKDHLVFDRNAYEITEAYFEDTEGKAHRVNRGRGLPRSILDESNESSNEVIEDAMLTRKDKKKKGLTNVSLPIGARELPNRKPSSHSLMTTCGERQRLGRRARSHHRAIYEDGHRTPYHGGSERRSRQGHEQQGSYQHHSVGSNPRSKTGKRMRNYSAGNSTALNGFAWRGASHRFNDSALCADLDLPTYTRHSEFHLPSSNVVPIHTPYPYDMAMQPNGLNVIAQPVQQQQQVSPYFGINVTPYPYIQPYQMYSMV